MKSADKKISPADVYMILNKLIDDYKVCEALNNAYPGILLNVGMIQISYEAFDCIKDDLEYEYKTKIDCDGTWEFLACKYKGVQIRAARMKEEE